MIFDTRIRYNGVRVRIRGASFRRFHNLRILSAGVESIKFRLEKGIGSDDAKTEPLSTSYARRKSKLTRRRAIRDLDFTGQMLSELRPRYADDNQAIADTSTRMGRMKARLYKELLLFSDNDQAAMAELAGKLFKGDIAPGAFASFRSRPGRFQARRFPARFAQ